MSDVSVSEIHALARKVLRLLPRWEGQENRRYTLASLQRFLRWAQSAEGRTILDTLQKGESVPLASRPVALGGVYDTAWCRAIGKAAASLSPRLLRLYIEHLLCPCHLAGMSWPGCLPALRLALEDEPDEWEDGEQPETLQLWDRLRANVEALQSVREKWWPALGGLLAEHFDFEPERIEAELQIELGGTQAKAEASVLDTAQPVRPRWDKERRQLWHGDTLCKQYRKRAENQETILTSFEELGWPPRIDDPLGRGKLRATLGDLEESLKSSPLRFRGDGSGKGILWELRPG